ncbi:uncharacterized protein CMU_019490 [Cryptosporidium muris RN66]|uniref:Uncharacterized protein n=1 Tax=Cryptosporidium muris (strain RN66) TaxID=441375 RepID=B6ACD6_CRYMR|nr:uncharacterized protein CMU_019490 [Cryptosporidium muris RN66]EEA06192.1 hypothetical protein, conserved [Cryptosporidium muris RN66]|eukprot:XP_002140541.1 hypothetical protein [Cryptosporidium muris RN66]
MRFITENNFGRLFHIQTTGGFGVPKKAGERVKVRFELLRNTDTKNILDDNYSKIKLPNDCKCQIWLMDAAGEFLDCVDSESVSALDGNVFITENKNNSMPIANIDLNIVQSSGCGIIVINLVTESNIFSLLEELNINIDIINPKEKRRASDISFESFKERDIWNILNYSPIDEFVLDEHLEDCKNIAIAALFVYGSRWHIQKLSKTLSTDNKYDIIPEIKEICHNINNEILKKYSAPTGSLCLRSLLLENKNIEDSLQPMIIRHKSSITDYDVIIKRLEERKQKLKEFIKKNEGKLLKGRISVNNNGEVIYISDSENQENTSNSIEPKIEDRFEENLETDMYTFESTCNDIQILKQITSELQLQLISIMDMFMSSYPPSFTLQGSGDQNTYTDVLMEIQEIDNKLTLYKQEMLLEDPTLSDIKLMKSNENFQDLRNKMDHLQNTIEIYGSNARALILDNMEIKESARTEVFHKVKVIEERFDHLNSKFSDFLLCISNYKNLDY